MSAATGIERLEHRFEQLLCKLRSAHEGDPTIVASFTTDFADLITQLEQGETTILRAGIELTELYKAHLPAVDTAPPDKKLPNKKKVFFAIRPRGQFYVFVEPGVWQAINAPLKGSCGQPQTNAYGDRVRNPGDPNVLAAARAKTLSALGPISIEGIPPYVRSEWVANRAIKMGLKPATHMIRNGERVALA